MEGMTRRRRRPGHKISVGVAALVVSLLGQAGIASAIGYGLSLKYGQSEGTLSEVDDEFADIDLMVRGFEVGFILDTNLARNRLFNYRVVGGFEYGAADWSGVESFSLYGGSITNTFGFGVWRSRLFRLYIGPDLRLSATTGSPGIAVDTDTAQVDIAVGASIGLNIHLGSISLSTSVAYYPQLTLTVFDGENGGPSGEFAGLTHRVSVGVAFMFRSSGDTYSP